jgi:hypothetical protein
MEYILTHSITYVSKRDGETYEMTSYLVNYSKCARMNLTESSLSKDHAKRFPTWRRVAAIKKQLPAVWKIERYIPDTATTTTN